MTHDREEDVEFALKPIAEQEAIRIRKIETQLRNSYNKSNTLQWPEIKGPQINGGTIFTANNLVWVPEDFGFKREATLPRWKNNDYHLALHPNDLWVCRKLSFTKEGKSEIVVTFYLQIKQTDIITAFAVFNTIRGINTDYARETFTRYYPELDKIPSYERPKRDSSDAHNSAYNDR